MILGKYLIVGYLGPYGSSGRLSALVELNSCPGTLGGHPRFKKPRLGH